MPSQSLLQLRSVILHPAPDRRVIDIEAALLQQLLNIAQRQGVAKIPPNRTKDETVFGLPPLEDRGSGYHLAILSRHQPPSRKVATHPVKLLVFFAARIPDWLRCLLFPATCTIFFGISWSAMHLETSDAVGIVSQRSFPALVGLITFVFLRFGNLIPGLIQPILNKRDVIPFPARALLTIAIPFFLSLVMNYQASVTNSAEKEQEIVLLSMVLAYLALVPNRLQAGRLQTIANSVRK